MGWLSSLGKALTRLLRGGGAARAASTAAGAGRVVSSTRVVTRVSTLTRGAKLAAGSIGVGAYALMNYLGGGTVAEDVGDFLGIGTLGGQVVLILGLALVALYVINAFSNRFNSAGRRGSYYRRRY